MTVSNQRWVFYNQESCPIGLAIGPKLFLKNSRKKMATLKEQI